MLWIPCELCLHIRGRTYYAILEDNEVRYYIRIYILYICVCIYCIHIYLETVQPKSLVILRSISPACKYLPVVRVYRLRYDTNNVSMAKLVWCKQTNNVISKIFLCRTNVLYVKYQSLVPGTSRHVLSNESLLSKGTSRG